MKTSHLIVLLASIAVLALLFFGLYFSGSSLVLDVAGENAAPSSSGTGVLHNRLPYFDLPTLAGDRVRSSDFTDTPLVLVFWATWNSDATDQIHILDQYLATHAPQDSLVKIVAIDSQEERSIVSSFMTRGGYQVETLLDAQGRTSTAYSVKSVPTFFFVDRTGVVQEISSGVMGESLLMNKIESILQ